MWRFTAALSVMGATKISFNRWMNKQTAISISYTTSIIHTMDYYSVIKSNELSSREKLWRKRKCMWSSERSQSGKAAERKISTLRHSGKAEPGERPETRNQGRETGAGCWVRLRLYGAPEKAKPESEMSAGCWDFRGRDGGTLYSLLRLTLNLKLP